MKDFLQKEYEIYQGQNSLADLNEFLIQKLYSACFVLCDENSYKYCFPLIDKLTPAIIPVVISAGEVNKTLKTCELVWEKLLAHAADRRAVLICLGGGMVTDLGGFAARTYKRGIEFIHVPTTLMGMTDAAIGGKLGLDFLGFKNVLGLFYHPEAIFIYPDFLNTLPRRELYSGMAEVIKHALIGDVGLWQKLLTLNTFDAAEVKPLIALSVAQKQNIVQQDPEEKNIRKLLNFGHTIGHAFESESLLEGNTPLLHGEAVAMGMICETWLSHQLCGLPADQAQTIYSYIMQHFPVRTELYPEDNLLKWMQNDKKNADNKIVFTLLTEPGKAIYQQYVQEKLISEAIRFYYSLVS